MNQQQLKTKQRERRKARIRRRIIGTPSRPRLSVYRSGHHTYVQLIDDLSGHTLASASTRDKGVQVKNGANKGAAADVGRRVAERARGAGIQTVVFDRNGFRYHGRIKALADAAREAGLKF
jgi:large subunit ribosomal protein L18